MSSARSNYQELAKLAAEYPELVRLQVSFIFYSHSHTILFANKWKKMENTFRISKIYSTHTRVRFRMNCRAIYSIFLISYKSSTNLICFAHRRKFILKMV